LATDEEKEALMGIGDVARPMGNGLCKIIREVVGYLDKIQRCHLVDGSE
jgi:hypothetical protein